MERQTELEAIGKDLLIRKGLSGLTIDGVAKASGYSRPTIYQHFKTKNSILDIVAQGTLKLASELAVAAAKVDDAPPRDRALTCVLAYEILARFHPGDFHILEYLGYPWILEELPDELRATHLKSVTGFSQQLGAHLQAAAENGELKLPASTTIASVTFHSIALVYGSYSSIIKNRVIFQLAETDDAWNAARASLDAFWNGHGWATSDDGLDHQSRAEALLKRAFPDYWLKLKTQELAREVERPGDGDPTP